MALWLKATTAPLRIDNSFLSRPDAEMGTEPGYWQPCMFF